MRWSTATHFPWLRLMLRSWFVEYMQFNPFSYLTLAVKLSDWQDRVVVDVLNAVGKKAKICRQRSLKFSQPESKAMTVGMAKRVWNEIKHRLYWVKTKIRYIKYKRSWIQDWPSTHETEIGGREDIACRDWQGLWQGVDELQSELKWIESNLTEVAPKVAA